LRPAHDYHIARTAPVQPTFAYHPLAAIQFQTAKFAGNGFEPFFLLFFALIASLSVNCGNPAIGKMGHNRAHGERPFYLDFAQSLPQPFLRPALTPPRAAGRAGTWRVPCPMTFVNLFFIFYAPPPRRKCLPPCNLAADAMGFSRPKIA